MHWRKEKGKYVYRYRDMSGSNRRVPIADYVQPHNNKEANILLGVLEAKYDERVARVKEQKAWHEKYYNFKALVAVFEKARKEAAPNSWQSKRCWFNYVLNYFLNIKHCPNLNEWKFHFEDFREHLKEVKPDRFKSKKELAYASKNHIINELNSFLRIMSTKRKCEPQPRMDLFKESLVDNFKDADSIISEEEFATIYNLLMNMSKNYADFYLLLRETGMRLNELRGISLNDIRAGEPPEKAIVNLYKAGGISIVYGYIVLRHQPLERDSRGNVEFKALKSKSKISNKFNRYIPISSIQAWKCLKRLVGGQKEYYDKSKFGDNYSNYCFFLDLINKNSFSSRLRKAYSMTSYNYKSPHCCRHTKASELASMDFTEQLAKMILGHSSKTTQRYIHLKDQMEKSEAVGAFDFSSFE